MFSSLVRFGMIAACLGLCASWNASATPPPDTQKALQIYFVDVEGGQATLFVTPTGQSLLIDTGWAGFDGRDADRIVAAAKDADLKRIDFILLTHYHLDHTGGVPQLATRIPIGAFIDHGENREPADTATQQGYQDYLKVVAEKNLKRTSAKPGDSLPLQGIETKVISSDGAVIAEPLARTVAKNAACDSAPQPPRDVSENPRSLGTLFTFGKLRILDLGDLTADKEMLLMCPVNKIGSVDIFIVSHHGGTTSNSPLLLNGIAPRVAIMDNGATKGGAPSSWDAIEKSPRLEDLWQLHLSEQGGTEHNVKEPFIANLAGPDAGNFLKLSVWLDGSFEIFNSRTRTTKRYTSAH